ncbi:MAG: hypothetical protein ACREMG_06935, partial [Gemmatimonadales bacterium]
HLAGPGDGGRAASEGAGTGPRQGSSLGRRREGSAVFRRGAAPAGSPGRFAREPIPMSVSLKKLAGDGNRW